MRSQQQRSWQAAMPDVHDHRLRSRLEKRHRMKNTGRRRSPDSAPGSTGSRPCEKRPGTRPAPADGPQQQQQVGCKPRHEHAAAFAQDEHQIRRLLDPPVRRYVRPKPTRVIRGVSVILRHQAPRGRKNDFIESTAAVSLYRWIAPAGSTCFGQTLVHSPTNVQPQIPFVFGQHLHTRRRALVAVVEVVPLRKRDGRRPDELRIEAVDRTCRITEHAVDAHAELLVLVQLVGRLQVFAFRQRLFRLDGRSTASPAPACA